MISDAASDENLASGDWKTSLDSGTGWSGQSNEAQAAALREMRAWSECDPDGAIAWVDRLVDDNAWEAFSTAICLQVFQRDPKAGLALVDRFRTDGRTSGLIGVLLAAWAERQTAAALEWARSQAGPEARDELIATVLQAAAYHAPEQAAASVSAITPGSAREEALRCIVGIWADKDPVSASVYAQSLADGPLRVAAMTTVADAVNRARILREDAAIR